MSDAFAALEASLAAALCTYTNVHRGSGPAAQATTRLFEQARAIVLSHLGLDPHDHQVVFCSPRRARALVAPLQPGEFQVLSSEDRGLPLGVRAVVVARRALGRLGRADVGGGTARLLGPDWVVWARAPERYEAGTPAILNVIAFARALQLGDVFRDPEPLVPSALSLTGRPLLEALRAAPRARVPTLDGERPYIHLDHAASTPTFAPVWDAVRAAWRLPASERPRVVDEARAACARFLGFSQEDYEVIFTSNTTEALNLVAQALEREKPLPAVLSTGLEHSSNDLPWRALPYLRAPHDPDGRVDLGAFEALFEGRHFDWVTVTAASNVLGARNDLGALAEITHRHGARLLVDAAQAVAHHRLDLGAIDALVFSAHKIYAPFGVGVLVLRRGLLELEEAQGEENVVGLAALTAALDLLGRVGMDLVADEERALTERLLRGLARLDRVTVHGVADPDSPAFLHKLGVVAFSVDGAMGPVVGDTLGASGVGIRWGCHCAHPLVKRVLGIHPLLEQFQRLIVTLAPRLQLPGVARVSLGLANTAADVDLLLDVLGKIPGPKRRPDLEPFLRSVSAEVFPG